MRGWSDRGVAAWQGRTNDAAVRAAVPVVRRLALLTLLWLHDEVTTVRIRSRRGAGKRSCTYRARSALAVPRASLEWALRRRYTRVHACMQCGVEVEYRHSGVRIRGRLTGK